MAECDWPSEPITKIDQVTQWLGAMCAERADRAVPTKAYRGLPNSAWNLRSTLAPSLEGRQGRDARKAVLALESKLWVTFSLEAQRIAAESDRALCLWGEEEAGQWDSLIFARHHGLPTRLIDWSDSPFVALFFACLTHPHDHGCVWWFEQDPIARQMVRRFHDLRLKSNGPRRQGDPLDEAAHLLLGRQSHQLWLSAFGDQDQDWITMLRPSRLFHRVEAQHGLATVASDPITPHDLLLDRLFPRHGSIDRGRLIIHRDLKPSVLGLLRRYHIGPWMMGYPVLDLVAQSIAKDVLG